MISTMMSNSMPVRVKGLAIALDEITQGKSEELGMSRHLFRRVRYNYCRRLHPVLRSRESLEMALRCRISFQDSCGRVNSSVSNLQLQRVMTCIYLKVASDTRQKLRVKAVTGKVNQRSKCPTSARVSWQVWKC